ncbi:hypothetical protein [Brachybacterium saurashtrense]|uniref:hypothetical protein n=1 Tax=Brachybacterium saurashtrense TaxID=556288 RepID=UPI0019D27F39|nr:hypothetical protein [Brachybacterium saurashtrense]
MTSMTAAEITPVDPADHEALLAWNALLRDGCNAGREAARARWIQTYTALDNAPMLALNRALGFREADVLSILEGELG